MPFPQSIETALDEYTKNKKLWNREHVFIKELKVLSNHNAEADLFFKIIQCVFKYPVNPNDLAYFVYEVVLNTCEPFLIKELMDLWEILYSKACFTNEIFLLVIKDKPSPADISRIRYAICKLIEGSGLTEDRLSKLLQIDRVLLSNVNLVLDTLNTMNAHFSMEKFFEWIITNSNRENQSENIPHINYAINLLKVADCLTENNFNALFQVDMDVLPSVNTILDALYHQGKSSLLIKENFDTVLTEFRSVLPAPQNHTFSENKEKTSFQKLSEAAPANIKSEFINRGEHLASALDNLSETGLLNQDCFTKLIKNGFKNNDITLAISKLFKTRLLMEKNLCLLFEFKNLAKDINKTFEYLLSQEVLRKELKAIEDYLKDFRQNTAALQDWNRNGESYLINGEPLKKIKTEKSIKEFTEKTLKIFFEESLFSSIQDAQLRTYYSDIAWLSFHQGGFPHTFNISFLNLLQEFNDNSPIQLLTADWKVDFSCLADEIKIQETNIYREKILKDGNKKSSGENYYLKTITTVCLNAEQVQENYNLITSIKTIQIDCPDKEVENIILSKLHKGLIARFDNNTVENGLPATSQYSNVSSLPCNLNLFKLNKVTNENLSHDTNYLPSLKK